MRLEARVDSTPLVLGDLQNPYSRADSTSPCFRRFQGLEARVDSTDRRPMAGPQCGPARVESTHKAGSRGCSGC